jgi:TonB family protein
MLKLAAVLAAAATSLAGCGGSNEESRSGGTTAAQEEGATTGEGAIPPEAFEEIDRFFKGKAAKLQFTCYNPVAEKTNKKYEGSINVQMMVEPGGRVDEVKVVTSSIGSPPIEECVVKEIRSWSWPSVPGRAPYAGTVTFKPAY